MQGVGHDQAEGRDLCIEGLTIVSHHLIAAMHGTERGAHECARGVLKTFPGLQVRLLTDDAVTFYFLYLAVTVCNDPVTGKQFLSLIHI